MTNHSERKQAVRNVFAKEFGGAPEFWVRAPGRVDIMGSYTDFNLGYVLALTLDRDTWIVARPRPDQTVNLFSLNMNERRSFQLSDQANGKEHNWSVYAQGVALMLQQDGHKLGGFDAVVHGTVPLGSGLSSSAAFEVATATLFDRMNKLGIDPVTVAKVGLRAENDVVGVKCGILDQYCAALGRKHTALLIDFKALSSRKVDFPKGVCTVICNTCVPRQLKGSAFDERRASCEQGAAQIARTFQHVKTLRDVSLEQFKEVESQLPPLVAKRGRFIIQENGRVLKLAEALAADDRAQIATLTAESYAGARSLFEITIPAMDQMMAAMRSGPGVIGARQAGAGFGGCLSAFVEAARAEEFVAHVLADYEKRSGIKPEVYVSHTSDGAGEIQ